MRRNEYLGLEELLLKALQNINYIEKTTYSYKSLLIKALIREALVLTTKEDNEKNTYTLSASASNH